MTRCRCGPVCGRYFGEVCLRILRLMMVIYSLIIAPGKALTPVSNATIDNGGIIEDNYNDGENKTGPEGDFAYFEEFSPLFLEPIVMTELWNDDQEKKYVYHYPKTTAISFKAFDENFQILVKRRDAIFGRTVSTTDFDPDDMNKNFVEGKALAADVFSSVCVYDAHFVKHPSYSGLMSLCDQRLNGILKYRDDGYQIWTSNDGGDSDSLADNETLRSGRKIYRIAKLSSERPSRNVLDLSFDVAMDEDAMANVTLKFKELKNNRTRWRAAMADVFDSTTITRYVELFILVDAHMAASHGNDRDAVNQKIAGIIALMNSEYKPLNIVFLVAHIKYGFSSSHCKNIDHSSADKFAKSYLKCIKRYRKESICQEPKGPMAHSDHTMAVTGQKFGNIIGMAYAFTICDWERSVSFAVSRNEFADWKVGVTITHELGHSFGAMHDWEIDGHIEDVIKEAGARPRRGCTCTLSDGTERRGETRKCIMAPYIDHQVSWSWSDCSYADIDFAKEANLHVCLYNRLDRYKNVESMLQSECGNGKIDPGEQCENRGTGCCTSRCVLRPGAQCNVGLCCSVGCKFKPAGTVCGAGSGDPCDQVDVCTGDSAKCQVRHKPSGSPCRTVDGQNAFCFFGSCRGQVRGCVDIMGPEYTANLGLIQFPLGRRKGRKNACGIKPCAKIHGITFTREAFLDKATRPCLTDEDSFCGMLFCRNRRYRHQALDDDSDDEEFGDGVRRKRDLKASVGRNGSVGLRPDFHRVMSDRFGAGEWLRKLKHLGLIDDEAAEKLRQGDDMSTYENWDTLNEYTKFDPLKWSHNSWFVYLPMRTGNPGMAPSGAPCGGGKMCHNGRCLTKEEFRRSINDRETPNFPLISDDGNTLPPENCCPAKCFEPYFTTCLSTFLAWALSRGNAR